VLVLVAWLGEKPCASDGATMRELLYTSASGKLRMIGSALLHGPFVTITSSKQPPMARCFSLERGYGCTDRRVMCIDQQHANVTRV
jgi:hypothetical protein